ncbi:cupredoxin domain-containing protein [Variovorax durovernensis]
MCQQHSSSDSKARQRAIRIILSLVTSPFQSLQTLKGKPMKHTFRNTASRRLAGLGRRRRFGTADHAGGHGHDADEAIASPACSPARAPHTINVDMTEDNGAFTPANISVKQGVTVRFVIKNSGQLKHELVIGTEKELKEHYEVMKKNPEMEHSDPNMVTLAAGKSGEIVWQFTKAGKVDFARLQPGHYDAGMKGAVNVTKTGKKRDAPAAHFHPDAAGLELIL